MKRITWKTREAEIKYIKPTPNNYKIATALGAERLKHTLKTFGLAGAVVCNWGGKVGDLKNLVLIDGNSRVSQEKASGTKVLEVSVPDRILTPKEYKEFSAMIDFAKAGEVDMDRIEKDLGTSTDWYDKYKLEAPMDLLNKLGKNAPKVKNVKEVEEKVHVETDERSVQLFYTIAQEKQFRAMEAKLMVKLKTVSTSDTIFKALKKLV